MTACTYSVPRQYLPSPLTNDTFADPVKVVNIPLPVIKTDPNEGVSLSLAAKIPGARMAVRPVNMEFLYGTSFMSQSPEAYERLILDTMRGEATLFARNDEVEAAWRICDPILQAWSSAPGPLPQYSAGSAGPKEADDLLEGGDTWRQL